MTDITSSMSPDDLAARPESAADRAKREHSERIKAGQARAAAARQAQEAQDAAAAQSTAAFQAEHGIGNATAFTPGDEVLGMTAMDKVKDFLANPMLAMAMLAEMAETLKSTKTVDAALVARIESDTAKNREPTLPEHYFADEKTRMAKAFAEMEWITMTLPALKDARGRQITGLQFVTNGFRHVVKRGRPVSVPLEIYLRAVRCGEVAPLREGDEREVLHSSWLPLDPDDPSTFRRNQNVKANEAGGLEYLSGD